MGFHFKKNGILFQKKWDSISKKMGFHFKKNGIPFQKKRDSISKKNGILYHKNCNINLQDKNYEYKNHYWKLIIYPISTCFNTFV